MKITERMALEIISHEAIIRQAYKDTVGVWTWSAGITSASGHSVERYIGNPQPMRRCIEVYLWLLDRYADDVRAAFKGHRLTEAQFTAALSFHWNTGAIKRAAWVRHFRAGNMAAARNGFMAWSKPKEIIGRRKKERDLFFDGKWSGDGRVTEFTRLTSRSTPDWQSGKRVNVTPVIREILGKPEMGNPVSEPKPVTPSKPAKPEPAPKPVKPINKPEPPVADLPEPEPVKGGGLVAFILHLLSKLFKGKE